MTPTKETSLATFAASLGNAPVEDAIQIAMDHDYEIRRLGSTTALTEDEAQEIAAREPGLLVVVQADTEAIAAELLGDR